MHLYNKKPKLYGISTVPFNNAYIMFICKHNDVLALLNSQCSTPRARHAFNFYRGGVSILGMFGLGQTLPYIQYSFNPWVRKTVRGRIVMS